MSSFAIQLIPMKTIRLICALAVVLSATTNLNAQRRIESPKVVLIEQKGDSVFCREHEIRFDVLDFEFDSCNFYNNRFFVSFRLVNKTEQPLLVHQSFISWYDTHSLRPTGSSQEMLRPGESAVITLESVPYLKKKMISPGDLLIVCGGKELKVPMLLKQESAKVKHCRAGEEVRY